MPQRMGRESRGNRKPGKSNRRDGDWMEPSEAETDLDVRGIRSADSSGGREPRIGTGPGTPKPKQEIPAGWKVERTVSLEIKADQQPVTPHTLCQPLTLDLTLARLPDGTSRVIASSPNGTVVSGIDIPAPTQKPRIPRYAAGLSYEPISRSWGGWVSRDIGPFVAGLSVAREGPDMTARLTAGVRW